MEDFTHWTTADGRELYIERMDFHHARNVLSFLDNRIAVDREAIRQATTSNMELHDWYAERIKRAKIYRANVYNRVIQDPWPLGKLRTRVKNALFHTFHPKWKIGDPR